MKFIATLSLLLVAHMHAAEVKSVNVGDRPESVTRGFDGKYFVSVMNSPGAAGDGVIKVIDGDTVTVFATGMDEPKGLTFTGEYLVTTDLKRVWKVDRNGTASILADAAAFPHPPSYLNDAAAAPDRKSVYVTDMGANTKMRDAAGQLWPLDSAEAAAIPVIGRVFRITLDGRVSVAVEANALMLNPNGVCAPAPGELLVAEFFQGNVLRQKDGKLHLLNSGFRGGDGIEQDRAGNIYLSSWSQGKVWKLDPEGKNPTVLIDGLQSAADFYLDEDAGLLLVPDMKTGKVHFLRLP